MRQFEIWWAELPEPGGWRPVLLLSRNDAYDYLSKFIALEITTTIRGNCQRKYSWGEEGLPKVCAANCDSLRMMPRQSLTKRAGQLAAERAIQVKRVMGAALGWRELTDLE